jgi:serine/threonine protein phosphatase PrpC
MTTTSVELEVGTCSDMGCVRENNEDGFLLVPELNLFVLSDGMGGLASGELASRLTVETVVAHCREAVSNPSLPLIGERTRGVTEPSNRLASAVRLANRIVHLMAEAHPSRGGMGATVVAVRCAEERMSLAHVGDSRVYLLRDDRLEQLTQDHSFVAEQVRCGQITEREAGTSNLQNVLLRAVGIEPEVEVDISEELLMEGDTVLLCSDGLTRELSDVEIATVLGSAEDAQQAADRLVNLAKQAGGADNITAIVVRHGSMAEGAFSKIGRLGKWLSGGGRQR